MQIFRILRPLNKRKEPNWRLSCDDSDPQYITYRHSWQYLSTNDGFFFAADPNLDVLFILDATDLLDNCKDIENALNAFRPFSLGTSGFDANVAPNFFKQMEFYDGCDHLYFKICLKYANYDQALRNKKNSFW